jgi:hypothetical protein
MFGKNDLTDRQANAKAARASMIEAQLAAAKADAPRLAEMQKQRAEIASARDARHAERDERKRAEKARLASQTEKALAAAREAQALRDAEAAAGAAQEAHSAMINRIVSDHADRKAARDERYANRKAAVGRRG